jgi:hypothetical protein
LTGTKLAEHEAAFSVNPDDESGRLRHSSNHPPESNQCTVAEDTPSQRFMFIQQQPMYIGCLFCLQYKSLEYGITIDC